MELTWNYIAWLKCLFYSLAFSFTTQETGELTGKWRERDQDVTETGIEHSSPIVMCRSFNMIGIFLISFSNCKIPKLQTEKAEDCVFFSAVKKIKVSV